MHQRQLKTILFFSGIAAVLVMILVVVFAYYFQEGFNNKNEKYRRMIKSKRNAIHKLRSQYEQNFKPTPYQTTDRDKIENEPIIKNQNSKELLKIIEKLKKTEQMWKNKLSTKPEQTVDPEGGTVQPEPQQYKSKFTSKLFSGQEASVPDGSYNFSYTDENQRGYMRMTDAKEIVNKCESQENYVAYNSGLENYYCMNDYMIFFRPEPGGNVTYSGYYANKPKWAEGNERLCTETKSYKNDNKYMSCIQPRELPRESQAPLTNDQIMENIIHGRNPQARPTK